jgi:hypothetical protein
MKRCEGRNTFAPPILAMPVAGLGRQPTQTSSSEPSTRVDGIAWTTDVKVAAGFATGGRAGPLSDPVIATGTIRKADILYAYAERGEAEIICQPKVISVEPASSSSTARQ